MLQRFSEHLALKRNTVLSSWAFIYCISSWSFLGNFHHIVRMEVYEDFCFHSLDTYTYTHLSTFVNAYIHTQTHMDGHVYTLKSIFGCLKFHSEVLFFSVWS